MQAKAYKEIERRFKDLNLMFVRFHAAVALRGLCFELERETVYDRGARVSLLAIADLTLRGMHALRRTVDMSSVELVPDTVSPGAALRLGKALAAQEHLYHVVSQVCELLSASDLENRDAVKMAQQAAREAYHYFLPEFEKALLRL